MDLDDEGPNLSELNPDGSLIRRIGKGSAYSLAILYGVGGVVVLLHLHRFGVVPTDLLRFQYLTAGLWFMVPLLVFELTRHWLLISLPRVKRILRGHFSKLFDSIMEGGFQFLLAYAVLSFVILSCFILGLTSLDSALRALKDEIGSFWLISIIAAWVADRIAVFYHKLRRLKLAKIDSIDAPIAGNVFISDPTRNFYEMLRTCFPVFATLVFAIILYFSLFAHMIYPSIPSGLGGGKSQQVNILLKQTPQLHDLKRSLHSLTDSCGHQHLLFATEQSYFLCSIDNKNIVLEIQRDAVIACKYFSNSFQRQSTIGREGDTSDTITPLYVPQEHNKTEDMDSIHRDKTPYYETPSQVDST